MAVEEAAAAPPLAEGGGAAATAGEMAAAAPEATAAGGSSENAAAGKGEGAAAANNSNKRPGGAVSEATSGEGAANAKRRKTGQDGYKQPKQKSREEMTKEELLAVLKRQVEYYLCDANLATDSFFHERIQEAEKQGKGVSGNITCSACSQLRFFFRFLFILLLVSLSRYV